MVYRIIISNVISNYRKSYKMCCDTRKYFCRMIVIQICLVVISIVIGQCKSDLINDKTTNIDSNKEYEYGNISRHLLKEPDVSYENFDELAKLPLKTDVATKIEKNFCANKTSEGKAHNEIVIYHKMKLFMR